MIYTKWSNLIGCYAQQRMVIGPGKSRHCQTCLERLFLWNENLQWNQNWTAKSTNLKEMLDNSSQFLSSEQPSELKNLHVVLSIVVNLEAIVVNLCVFCGRWFSNQFEIVSETPLSCDTVGLELKWAVLCSLLCPETDWNIRIGKQGYVFLFKLTDFRRDILMFRIADISQCVNNYFETEKSWIY